MIVERHHKPHKRDGVELKCKVCGGVFYVKASRATKAKTCSGMGRRPMCTMAGGR